MVYFKGLLTDNIRSVYWKYSFSIIAVSIIGGRAHKFLKCMYNKRQGVSAHIVINK